MGCSDGDGVWGAGKGAGAGRLGSEAVNLMLLQGEGRERGPAMEEECSARPCATDFSIAAIMARDRQERRERRRHKDPREDTLTPLGKKSQDLSCFSTIYFTKSMAQSITTNLSFSVSIHKS